VATEGLKEEKEGTQARRVVSGGLVVEERAENKLVYGSSIDHDMERVQACGAMAQTQTSSTQLKYQTT
jgi:hypothetical protein